MRTFCVLFGIVALAAFSFAALAIRPRTTAESAVGDNTLSVSPGIRTVILTGKPPAPEGTGLSFGQFKLSVDVSQVSTQLCQTYDEPIPTPTPPPPLEPCGLGAYDVQMNFDPAMLSFVTAADLAANLADDDGDGALCIDAGDDGNKAGGASCTNPPADGDHLGSTYRLVSCFTPSGGTGWGRYHCSTLDFLPTGPLNGGKLATYTFSALALGTVSMTLTGSQLLDIQARALTPVALQSGTVRVIACPDINGDKKINSGDKQVITANFNDKPGVDGNGDGIFGYTTQRDVNGDGKLNSGDSQVLTSVFNWTCQ